MKHIWKAALALLLAASAGLSLAGCGAETAETAAATAAAETTVETTVETAPGEHEIAAKLMEGYLAQENRDIRMLTDYGLTMAHNGAPVQSWDIYVSDDKDGLYFSGFWPRVYTKPENTAETIQALWENAKPGELQKGEFCNYLVQDSEGYYCWLNQIGPEGAWKAERSILGMEPWSFQFCWMEQKPQRECLEEYLQDPEAHFTLSEEEFWGQDSLCVSYEMAPGNVRALSVWDFQVVFEKEQWYEEPMKPVLRKGSVRVSAYFDPETGYCLGETMDLTSACGRLLELLLEEPNVAEGTGRVTVEKRYFPGQLEALPEIEGFAPVETPDPHRLTITPPKMPGALPSIVAQTSYELRLDPINRSYRVLEEGKEIALLLPYFKMGEEIFNKFNPMNGYVTQQEALSIPGCDGDISTVALDRVLDYYILEGQPAYIARVFPKGNKDGIKIFSWDRETAVKIAESFTFVS